MVDPRRDVDAHAAERHRGPAGELPTNLLHDLGLAGVGQLVRIAAARGSGAESDLPPRLPGGRAAGRPARYGSRQPARDGPEAALAGAPRGTASPRRLPARHPRPVG